MADAGFIADLSTFEAEAVFACYVTEMLRATPQRTQTLSNLPGGSGHLPGGSLRPLNANLATSLTHSALEAFRALPWLSLPMPHLHPRAGDGASEISRIQEEP